MEEPYGVGIQGLQFGARRLQGRQQSPPRGRHQARIGFFDETALYPVCVLAQYHHSLFLIPARNL